MSTFDTTSYSPFTEIILYLRDVLYRFLYTTSYLCYPRCIWHNHWHDNIGISSWSLASENYSPGQLRCIVCASNVLPRW